MIDSTTFLKRLKNITLSRNERLMLREKLVAYSDMHPIVEDGSIRSPFGNFFFFIESRRFTTYAMAMLLVLVGGSGVTLAADASVPGESLYSIKIHINEPVLTALTPTATGQARVAAELATRRIDEAVILASRGELTAERQTYLTQEFDMRAKVAATKADHLAATGNSIASDNVKANFVATLAGEAQALGAITTKDSGKSAELLRAVVAVSETISINGPGEYVVVAATAASDTEAFATSTRTSGTQESVRMMTKIAPQAAGSTTPQVGAKTRLQSNLRINGAPLQGRLAPSLTGALMLPKSDVAIPAPAISGTTAETGGVQGTSINPAL